MHGDINSIYEVIVQIQFTQISNYNIWILMWILKFMLDWFMMINLDHFTMSPLQLAEKGPLNWLIDWLIGLNTFFNKERTHISSRADPRVVFPLYHKNPYNPSQARNSWRSLITFSDQLINIFQEKILRRLQDGTIWLILPWCPMYAFRKGFLYL